MNGGPDRLQLLKEQKLVTGIDFVFVEESQTNLFVYFHHDPTGFDDGFANLENLTADNVVIRTVDDIRREIIEPGFKARRIGVSGITWPVIDGVRVMRIETGNQGDYSVYSLRIEDPQERIDPYFNDLPFSFKAGCKSDIDCKTKTRECPAEHPVDFPVDYQARDFWSIRRALLDFASQRYPQWEERLEADVGVMLVEAMSVLGDELSFYQDRVAREAFFETATQRRSLRRHARLVDYTIHDGLAATGWLDVTVRDGQTATISAGAAVRVDPLNALDHGGDDEQGRVVPGAVHFEVGRRLREGLSGEVYRIDSARNRFNPHIWDEDETCLKKGALGVDIQGHRKNALALDEAGNGESGRWMLLSTNQKPGIPERCHLVRVVAANELMDPLLGAQVTRLWWKDEHALPYDFDLEALEVRGNLIPITAGRRHVHRFVVGMDPTQEQADEGVTRAAEWCGPAPAEAPENTSDNGCGEPMDQERTAFDRPPSYLFGLPGSEDLPLCWVANDFQTPDPDDAGPEIELREEAVWDSNAEKWKDAGESWTWRPSFLRPEASQSLDRDFILEDGAWKPVATYRRGSAVITHSDYASGEGATIRFGDGRFGRRPDEGTVFEVRYRLGGGRSGNVEADTITHPVRDDGEWNAVEAVTNPFPTTFGAGPETFESIRLRAPHAFRESPLRAVKPEDYARAAEKFLPWVQRAGAVFRWTGSWVTAFVTPDPLGAVTLNDDRRADLEQLIDRVRQTGREARVAAPRYADLDLRIKVCVAPASYRGEVKERILGALVGPAGAQTRPFFSPDRFTFGDPLYRSQLEAAIHGIQGVRAVGGVDIRRRGYFGWRPWTSSRFGTKEDEVIRVENDPNHPDRGSVRLTMEGGA